MESLSDIRANVEKEVDRMRSVVHMHAADVEKEVDRMRSVVHMHASAFTQINEFVAALGRADGCDGTYVSLGYAFGSLTGVIVQVHLAKEETFKACTPIVDFLLSSGWEQDGQEDNVDWGYRQIAFKKRHSDDPMEIPELTCTVRMWLHLLSDTA